MFVSADNETNAEDPWSPFAGACLQISDFAPEVSGELPITRIMDGIVRSGTGRDGRTRNGFFAFAGGYHEMTPMSWVGAGSLTYRILGYDDSGEEGPGPRRRRKRVVELPWALAPSGAAVFAELTTDPQEYGSGDKIVYRLSSPRLGVARVSLTCCTADEASAYEAVADGALGAPDPPVRFTRTPEQCEEMEPAYKSVE